jgi:anaerobic selenocysteine-containing dehydrogenase
MKVSRRKFVGAGLAAGAAAACAGCRPVFMTQVLGRAGTGKRPTGPISWVNGACLQCPAGCGIRVKTIAGDAIKIEGNPLHPINKGRLCPKGQAGLQVLYDPDRIQGPMRKKRIGDRGAGPWDPAAWESITWGQAIAEVAERLAAIRKDPDRGPHTVAILGGRYRGHMRELFSRFARSYGTPNEIDSASIGSGNSMLAHYLTQGVHDYLAYDWENANYVISLGASLIEAFRPTLFVQRMVAYMRRGRPGIRGKIVTVDPRHSVTACKSDEWIPIRPGTDGALALGMAKVIVEAGLHDQGFLKEHTAGFDEWKENVLDEVSLDFVSQQTDIPVDRIEQLGREFAQQRPSFAVAGRGAGMHTNGLYNLMAIHCLNALVGNIDSPGGVMVQEYPSLTAWPAVEPDEIALAGLSRPRLDGAGTSRFPLAESVSAAFAEAILGESSNESPYEVSAALVYYTNPVFSTPNPQKSREAFGKIPLLVSFSPVRDDTTAMADYVLPDHTYLERLQLDVPVAGAGFPVLTLRQPVIEPLHDTRNTGEVLIQIANHQAMRDTIGAAFPWGDYQESDFEQPGTGHEEAMKSTLVGVAEAASLSPEELWQKLLEEGVWSGGPYEHGNAERTYRTASGKFEFVSSLMKQRLTAVADAEGIDVDKLVAELEIEARGQKVFMPHYESPSTTADDGSFPLYLNSYKTMTRADGRGTNQPWLQECYGVQFDEFWDSWVEIHPDIARTDGILDGQMIILESEIGELKVKARVFDGATRNVVNMPFEYGHLAGGHWAKDLGVNPNEIAGAVHDRLSGVVSHSALRVRIRKADT